MKPACHGGEGNRAFPFGGDGKIKRIVKFLLTNFAESVDSSLTMRAKTRFGVILERVCSAHDLTQGEVAQSIGVTQETLSRWKVYFSPRSDELFRALGFLRRYERRLTAEDLVGPAADSASEAAS